ncbi:MAG TPA: LCP family protein [Candidatus Eremiobacteraceae bacterium]|nr:LCP family protein [Candidatus Eremiobacteraceae bacterium]
MLARRPLGRRTTLIIIAAVVIVLIALITTAFLWRSSRHWAGGVAARLTMGDKPMNVLLIANNGRDLKASDPLGLGSAAGQADVILLARVDPRAHAIYAITIPRDALIAQPRWHNSVPKIKTLFFMGDQETPPRGPQYLTQAVSALTGLPIDGYIVANFAGFKEAVDYVGGLTVNVKERIYDPQFSHADFKPGVQHMNGAQALAFIRVRQNQAGNSYRINDYQRMQAEVEVLGLLRNKLLDPAHASTLLPAFVSHMNHDVATNLPHDRLVRVGIAMAGAPVFQVPIGSVADSMILARADVPGINHAGIIDEAEYVVLDPAQVQARLAEFGSHSSSTGLPPFPAPGSVRIELHGSKHLALHLEHLGFVRLRIVGGPTGEQRVVYPSRQPVVGWQVARATGIGNMYVQPGSGDVVTVYE